MRETDFDDEVAACARVLEHEGRLGLTRGFIQHGDVTVYAHVVSVARASVAAAEALGRVGVRVDRASLVRGALLHDYFLYDWHDPDPSHRLHGFRHPFFALARAEEDFDLTPRERNIIVRHMFPLVPVPPTCREAWIVCLADKWCALRETVAGRMPSAVRGAAGESERGEGHASTGGAGRGARGAAYDRAADGEDAPDMRDAACGCLDDGEDVRGVQDGLGVRDGRGACAEMKARAAGKRGDVRPGKGRD